MPDINLQHVNIKDSDKWISTSARLAIWRSSDVNFGMPDACCTWSYELATGVYADPSQVLRVP